MVNGSQGQRPAVGLTWEQPLGLYPLSFKVFFLRLITLGIYHFWGKTEVRRKIWSAVRLEGQPLQYTGTGMELFLGFLIAFFLIILPLYAAFIGLILYFGETSVVAIVGQYVFIVLILYLVAVAQYRARNYRLSRTNWRGIRGHMAGSSFRYAGKAFLYYLSVPFTLGWSIPWMEVRLNKILTEETRFGTERLQFEGSSKPLYLPFAVLWLGVVAIYAAVGAAIYFLIFFEAMRSGQASNTPPSPLIIVSIMAIALLGFILFAIVSAWYQSRKLNYFASRTTIDRARFHLNTSPLGLIWLTLSNLLIVLLTIGILTPIAQTRLARYFVERMGIDGAIDFARIAQSHAGLSKTGEGLAEAFDIDAF